MADFLATLLRLSLLGTLLAVGLALALRLLGDRISRAAGYYLWLLVLLRLVLPLGVSVPLPAAEGPAGETISAAPARSAAPVDGDVQETGMEPAAPAPAAPSAAPAVGRQEAPVETGAPEPELADLLASPALWTGIWAAGAVICLGRYVWGYRRFVRALRRTARSPAPDQLAQLRRLDPRRRAALLVSDAAPSPLLMGAVRPVLVLPPGITDQGRLWDVLRHELTHARRHDLLYKWLAAAVTSLHWFNPAMVLVRREIARCCELACDEAVTRTMAPNQRRHYGETLLALAAPPPAGMGLLATTLCEEKKRLKERLVAIVNDRKRGPAALILTALLLVVLGACALINGARPAQTGAPAAPARTTEGPVEQRDDPDQSPRPVPAAGERADGYDLYPLGELTVAVPAQRSDQLLVFPYEDAVAIYEKASYEQAGEGMEMGWIGSVIRWDQLRYEQEYLRCGGGSGGLSFFARDANWYYGWSGPTDVRFYRADGTSQAELEAGEEQWRELMLRLPDEIQADFLARNGLEAFEDDFFTRDFVWDSRTHYYASYHTPDYSASLTLVLSQPARQGEGGVWCVEQWVDNAYGTAYRVLPDTGGLLAADYFAQLQDQADQGQRPGLLDPEQAALEWLDQEGYDPAYGVTLLDGEPGGNVYGRMRSVLDQPGTLSRVIYAGGQETERQDYSWSGEGGQSRLGSWLYTRLYIKAQAPAALEGEAIVYTADSGGRVTFLAWDNLIRVEQGGTEAWFTMAYDYTPTPYEMVRETLEEWLQSSTVTSLDSPPPYQVYPLE